MAILEFEPAIKLQIMQYLLSELATTKQNAILFDHQFYKRDITVLINSQGTHYKIFANDVFNV